MHMHETVFTFVNVGLCVRVAWCLSRLSSEQPPQVGPHLVASLLCHSVTLGTSLDKDFLPFANVTHGFVVEDGC